MLVSGWGNYPFADTVIYESSAISNMINYLDSSLSCIARGCGRAYGDSAINNSLILSSQLLTAMLSFDSESGVLSAESGVTIKEILDTFAHRGWFVPVTPGTKFVTLGGAIASDVHGKDHHVAGSFGNHVLNLEIWTSSYGLIKCSPDNNPDLFWATIGGHGLTGFIVKATIKLIKIPSLYVTQTTIKTKNIYEIMDLFEYNDDYQYSVAWIDCLSQGNKLGRSIFMGGYFSDNEELEKIINNQFKCKKSIELTVPFNFPSFVLNRLTVKAFNFFYYTKFKLEHTTNIVYFDKFFYPLDFIYDWNRIYGKRGFLQYQFVIPLESARKGLPEILQKITNIGTGSFLAVLKLFGNQEFHEGNISFPSKGYTLALDFPINSNLFHKLDELDKIVLFYNGKHYLTKDSRLSSESFFKSYGNNLLKFLDIKQKWDNRNCFRSLQSDRLKLS